MKTLSVWTATLVSLAIFGLTAYASPAGCPAHLPAGTINHHWTKDLTASPDGSKLYATVGSNSNAGENGLAAEQGRAAVWEIDPKTGSHRIFASGLRNPVGLAWEPATRALWVAVNERDALGSDVPFFLMGGTAVGLGRGTELYPLPDIQNLPALLISPGIHVSTPDAYLELRRQLTGGTPSPIINDFQGVAQRIAGGWPAGEWRPVNDFESVVFGQHPQLESIKGTLLRAGARPALMSGSGCTLFGIFSSREVRDRAVRLLRQDFARDQVFPVTMISRSRYQKMWRKQLAVPMRNKLWPWPPQEYKE